MQRERRDTEVLEVFEEAFSLLRHGGNRDGLTMLSNGITALDRHIQEQRIIERAQRIGFTAPSVIRAIHEYQRQFPEG
jgi:hypothetical protein